MAMSVGVLFAFGLLIHVCNKAFYASLGRAAHPVCYATGVIGTPVHECAHALFCLIFGHKIIEVKLFQTKSEDGTLGYVKHTCNPKNVYHRIGNFFIGVAPILVISALLYLLAYLLVPMMLTAILSDVAAINPTAGIAEMAKSMIDISASVFSYMHLWQWWVFLILAIFLALHMTLSPADIKGALGGLLFLVPAILLVDVILFFAKKSYLLAMTDAITTFGGILVGFMSFALIIALIALGLAKGVGKLIAR